MRLSSELNHYNGSLVSVLMSGLCVPALTLSDEPQAPFRSASADLVLSNLVYSMSRPARGGDDVYMDDASSPSIYSTLLLGEL